MTLALQQTATVGTWCLVNTGNIRTAIYIERISSQLPPTMVHAGICWKDGLHFFSLFFYFQFLNPSDLSVLETDVSF